MIKNDNNQKKSIFFLSFARIRASPRGTLCAQPIKRTVEQRVNCEFNTSQGRVDKIFPVWFRFWFGQNVASYFGLFRHCHGVISAGFLDTLGND